MSFRSFFLILFFVLATFSAGSYMIKSGNDAMNVVVIEKCEDELALGENFDKFYTNVERSKFGRCKKISIPATKISEYINNKSEIEKLSSDLSEFASSSNIKVEVDIDYPRLEFSGTNLLGNKEEFKYSLPAKALDDKVIRQFKAQGGLEDTTNKKVVISFSKAIIWCKTFGILSKVVACVCLALEVMALLCMFLSTISYDETWDKVMTCALNCILWSLISFGISLMLYLTHDYLAIIA